MARGPADQKHGANGAVNTQTTAPRKVAIVGTGCRLPGSAVDPEAYFKLLMAKEDAQSKIPNNRFNVDKFVNPDRNRPGSLTTAGGYFLRDDPTLFEPQLFNMNVTEATTIDPALKKLLEVVYETIDSAGIPLSQLAGSNTGCYVGSFNHDELFAKVRDTQFANPYTGTSAIAPFLANRLSYIFDLHGPSMTVDTACSASFYALHLACQAIRHGDIDSAIVASSNLVWSPDMQLFLDKLGALSPTSKCHVFGADADGYGRADGFVGFFLKDLESAIRDNDPIQAVIAGTAVNANGRTGGITHPSPAAQEAAMKQAYLCDGSLDPKDTAYYECHGTGTAVGDPLELQGIQSFFSSSRSTDNPLLLGSVKANIGHGEPVSGLAGLLKTVLAIQHDVIPPMVTPSKVNPALNLDESKFKILSEAHQWPEHLPRRASVASSGFGGANAHVVVEEYKAPSANKRSQTQQNGHADKSSQPKFLIPFSAHKAGSLTANFEAVQAVSDKYSAVDLAYTLGVRRSQLLYKGFSTLSEQDGTPTFSKDGLRSAKRLRTTAPKIGFVFTGQGAQWPQMGKELFKRFPLFEETIHHLTSTLKKLSDGPSWSLEDILLAPADESKIYDAEISQPACTAIQLGLVEILKSWNVNPSACVGHSSGEMAAAHAAGLITKEEAMIAAYYRGKSVAQLTREGSMIAVGLGGEAAEGYLKSLKPKIGIAALNSPESTTVSGEVDTVKEFSEILKQNNVFNRILATGGKAYHSRHMEEIGQLFEDSMHSAIPTAGQAPHSSSPVSFYSSVSGKLAESDLKATPRYWRGNLENPVLFSPAFSEMVDDGVDLVIEVGPHSALAGPIRQIESTFRTENKSFPMYTSTLARGKDGEDCMLELAGTLFNDSASLNIQQVNRTPNADASNSPVVLTDLPTYQYAYGPSAQRYNRPDREFRYPEFGYHDLLGSKLLGGSPRAPSWRNVLSAKSSEIIRGATVSGASFLPVSCLLTMVVAAAQQINLSKNNDTENAGSKITIRDAIFPNPVLIDSDRDIVTSFQSDAVQQDLYSFEISSVYGEEHTEADLHCSGKVHIESKSLQERNIATTTPGGITTPVSVPASKWYTRLQDTGLAYEPNWQRLDKVASNPFQSLLKSDLTQGPEGVAGQVGSIEACLQLAFFSTVPGGQPRAFKTPVRPTAISKFVYDEHQKAPVSGSASAYCEVHGSASEKSIASAAFSSLSNEPIFTFEKITLEAIGQGTGLKGDANAPLTAVRKPDYSVMSSAEAAQLFPPPEFPGINIFQKVYEMASAMVIQYISQSEKPKEFCEAGASFYDWLENAYTRAQKDDISYGKQLLAMEPGARTARIEKLYNEVSEESVEAKLMMRMYKDLSGVIDGSVSAHDLILNDGLLQQLYTSTLTAMGSMVQLRRVIDLVGHKNPAARYVEIGGGSRGTTREIMDVLGGHKGAQRYGHYSFTDISSYFLSGAKEEFAGCGDISYAPFDVEKLPRDQGFEEGSYDVVVAANVLHATASVKQTLEHARAFLKPGGKLILVETTIETVWLTIVLGGFQDYWKGRKDGRPSSPFLSVSQWQQILPDSGFTAPELDLPDYEDPFRTMNVLVSTKSDEPTSVPKKATSADSIERFYPLDNSSESEETQDKTLSKATEATRKPFVLVDWAQDPYFLDLALWLAGSGIQSLIIGSSTKEQKPKKSDIETLEAIGLKVHVLPEPLISGDDSKFSLQLSTITPYVEGLILNEGPQTTADLAQKKHTSLQQIFAGPMLPSTVVILSSSVGLLADSAQDESKYHAATQSIADSWAKMRTSANILYVEKEGANNSAATVAPTSFDDLVSTLDPILAAGKSTSQQAKSYIFGASAPEAVEELKSRLEGDERFSIILHSAEAKARARSGGADGDDDTAKAAALAKFQGTDAGDKDAQSGAAVEVVAEILAELLFMPREQVNVEDRLEQNGIDSLVASELRTQLKDCFGADLSNQWLLSGDVTVVDVVNKILAG